jgi:hypothetical protein
MAPELKSLPLKLGASEYQLPATRFEQYQAVEGIGFSTDAAVITCAQYVCGHNEAGLIILGLDSRITADMVEAALANVERLYQRLGSIYKTRNRIFSAPWEHRTIPEYAKHAVVAVWAGEPVFMQNRNWDQVKEFVQKESNRSQPISPCIFQVVPYQLELKDGQIIGGNLLSYAQIGASIYERDRQAKVKITPYYGIRNFPRNYFDSNMLPVDQIIWDAVQESELFDPAS